MNQKRTKPATPPPGLLASTALPVIEHKPLGGLPTPDPTLADKRRAAR